MRNDIQKRLAVIGSAYLTGYHHARVFLELVLKGKLMDVTNYDRPNDWRLIEDFKNPNSTSTYQDCIEVSLHPADDDSPDYILLVVWDGDALDGRPQTVRATYRLEGEWWLHEKLSEQVLKGFNHHCMVKAEREEALARARRLAKRAAEIGEREIALLGVENISS